MLMRDLLLRRPWLESRTLKLHWDGNKTSATAITEKVLSLSLSLSDSLVRFCSPLHEKPRHFRRLATNTRRKGFHKSHNRTLLSGKHRKKVTINKWKENWNVWKKQYCRKIKKWHFREFQFFSSVLHLVGWVKLLCSFLDWKTHKIREHTHWKKPLCFWI